VVLVCHRSLLSVVDGQRGVLEVEVEVADLFVIANGVRLGPIPRAPEAGEVSVEGQRYLACLAAVLHAALAWRRRVALFRIHFARSPKIHTDWISENDNISINLAMSSCGKVFAQTKEAQKHTPSLITHICSPACQVWMINLSLPTHILPGSYHHIFRGRNKSNGPSDRIILGHPY